MTEWKPGGRARRGRSERGAAAIEFALVLLPLVTLLLGMLQFGWYFHTTQSTSAAAREGARRVVVGDCTAAGELLTFVQAQAPMATSAAFTPSTPLVGQSVTVTVEADGNIINFLPLPNAGVVVQQFQARVEDVTASAGGCPA